MDKNTIIGFVLIAAVLIGFTIYSSPSKEELAKQEQARIEKQYRDSLAYINDVKATEADTTQKSNVTDDFFAPSAKDSTAAISSDSLITTPSEEKFITLENSKLKVVISSRGGRMISAQLKDYSAYNQKSESASDSLFLFKNDSDFGLKLINSQNKELLTNNLNFTPAVIKGDSTVVMRYTYADKQYVDFIYRLSPDDYLVKYDIEIVGMKDILSRQTADIFELNWTQKLRRQEKSIKNEQRYSHIYYKYQGGDVEKLSESKNEQKEAKEPTRWIAFKDQFFTSTIIADEKFETILLDSKILSSDNYLKTYDAKIYIPASFDKQNDILSAGMSYYLGPLIYSHLKAYDADLTADKKLDLDQLVPLGWSLFRFMNQYFIIPLFNLLNSTGMTMGLVILLLTIIVKIIISPLTYKSFMSSAKMRVLRPQVEEINAKYPKQEQAMEKQQAVMALYSKAGASPMAGCIPMLLQMPVLIALFSFFPTAIELRHQSFLWASDLSTYDAIFEWKAQIPVISWALGNHISLFCILMTATNIIYTKFNMDATNTGQQQMPGMKWMMYLMPLIFLFVLNDYPSGLTYYYFVSTLITILLTIAFRYAVDEEKLLAKLEANKAKPKKKSGFMARLEEAQRMQQQQLRDKNKKGGKKK